MNFFEQQDQAHRESKKLLLLFFLAVIAIVLAVNAAAAGLWLWGFGGRFFTLRDYPPIYFFYCTAATLLFIGSGTLYEMYRLRDGGDAVAQMAGGRLVMPASQDLQERRLLNIVEEMALAAGIACPHVYILDHEEAINAFAAGYHQNEAVVAVTRGTLNRLSRDELQGVIGHEFSHILNGDMRMNIKLIGILFGIQMLASLGQELLYWGSRFGGSRSRNDKGPPVQLIMLVFGVALFVIGYVGIFFGRLIKSAVSRQREFLADASAVQFTRNPDGIGGALRKIGGLSRVNECGSRIEHPRAEQFSHMFLGAAKVSLMSGLFATHPPLQERLRRVYGKSMPFIEVSAARESVPDPTDTDASGFGYGNAMPGQFGVASSGQGVPVQPVMGTTDRFADTGLPMSVDVPQIPAIAPALGAAIRQAARDTSGACSLVYALLLDRQQAGPYALQLQLLQQAAPAQAVLAEALLSEVEAMPRSMRLPMLDMAMPALRLLDAAQKAQLLGLVSRLIAADQRVTQAEFVLQTVLERRLGVRAGRVVPISFGSLSALRAETVLLFSLAAHTQTDSEAILSAFQRAAMSVPELGLTTADLHAADSLDFSAVRQALLRLNQLAPLAKPFLIRGLLAALMAAPAEKMQPESADLLRGICAAIDAPVPDQVSATYTS
ncbi:M48 family metallopeptidase [Undibacterium sp. TS12]|uniref:M48 family metallopeptidase n=1 Tax=Undibacterium sp. TS12 TaxID=2908202 RepID=UPI001F4CA9FE|nr:M48 family metallopeptidase [Undibacterium sp. TS12]MCH8621126.1 M48 family metallopeptidase [Undibacterium sp. TS12]